MGRVPTTAKCGVDATIPENVPRQRYHRISYAYANQVRLEDYLGEGERPGAPAVSVVETQKVGKTYNKFAQWLALPTVPDVFL